MPTNIRFSSDLRRTAKTVSWKLKSVWHRTPKGQRTANEQPPNEWLNRTPRSGPVLKSSGFQRAAPVSLALDGNNTLVETCYLCGKEITESDVNSNDHAVPRQLITRKQPKAKGFDYGGALPTHEKCNNEFGPETYCVKALKLIAVLHDANCVSRFQHKKDSSITMMAINSDCLKEFTQRDLAFSKFIDVRKSSIGDFSTPTFFSGKLKANPMRDALFTSLAVLTKSAAALLIARHLCEVPPHWRVLAIPYSGAIEATDFDEIFGNTQPFDVGVRIWLRHFNSGDWFVLYRAQNILVFFLFRFSETDAIWNGIIERFHDADRLFFEGEHLNALIDYQWRKV